MIKVRDLMNWAKDNAKCVTLSNPEGFVNGDSLMELANRVKENEPFDFIPRRTKIIESTEISI